MMTILTHITTHILPLAQIVVAILLITSILLQQRGSGLSSAFGGQGGVYYQRRGFEKILVILSVIFGVLWAALAVASLIGF